MGLTVVSSAPDDRIPNTASTYSGELGIIVQMMSPSVIPNFDRSCDAKLREYLYS